MRQTRTAIGAAFLFTLLSIRLDESVTAQDRDRDEAPPRDRALTERVQRPIDDPPVEPTPVGPDPDAALLIEFHRSLDAISENSRREVRLSEARRLAPFDLDWGLR